MTSTLSSQRFCLRWNNHQSNLLSVFDQLLHDESFVDVTLAVEGRFLRAHKMVLSACSPYFQALFVGHPDKHPIVILKDVPYCDMRSLLDFMYRGEVSVDQDRLTAFLKVAESLRIKGLTEVNEEKCDLPSITSSLLSSVPPPVVTTHTPPPPHLHRIHPTASHKRTAPPTSATPLLGSALTAPKRKRGRPRKLSGSSGGPPNLVPAVGGLGGENSVSMGSRTQAPPLLDGNGELETSNRVGGGGSTSDIVQGSPEMLEVKMSMDFQHSPATSTASSAIQRPSEGENGHGPTSIPSPDHTRTSIKDVGLLPGGKRVKEEPEPTPGPSSQDPGQAFVRPSSAHEVVENYALDPLLLPKLETPPRQDSDNNTSASGGGGDSGGTLTLIPGGGGGSASAPPSAGRPPTKRRARRRATSASQDPAEQLTEMSVRGLNLFRYASISEGVYKCTECAKADVQKTFKNKYSFQRHAFLYHEGHQRKVFPCPVCAKEFSRPDKMKNHMKTVHDCFMPKDCVFPLDTNYGMEEHPSITFELCSSNTPSYHHPSSSLTLIGDSSDDQKMGLVVHSLSEGTAGVHFLSHEVVEDDGGGGCIVVTKCEETDSEDLLQMEGGGTRGRHELLEYLIREDGSVVCKWCGEVLPSRTHWYRHKYKFHVPSSGTQSPASLLKCHRCNVFFKSRKGYTGHIASRHGDEEGGKGGGEDLGSRVTAGENSEGVVGGRGPGRRSTRSSDQAKGPDYEKQREKEEKLVADIIDRVRRECEAQGETVTRRGYSRRSTVMNS